MSASKKKDIVRGKRYTPEEKQKVVTFVTEYNATNGRGGQSSASAKFGISQLTISSWLKGSGVSKKTKSFSPKGSMQDKLTTMLALGKEIEALEKELKAKVAKFESLKAAL